MADPTRENPAENPSRFDGDRIHDNLKQPGFLTEGDLPAHLPASRDEAVVDAEFSGLDNDLIDMGQFGDTAPTDDGLTDLQPDPVIPPQPVNSSARSIRVPGDDETPERPLDLNPTPGR